MIFSNKFAVAPLTNNDSEFYKDKETNMSEYILHHNKHEGLCVISHNVLCTSDTEQYHSVMFTSYTDAKCDNVQNKEQCIMLYHTACNKKKFAPFSYFSCQSKPDNQVFAWGSHFFPGNGVQ